MKISYDYEIFWKQPFGSIPDRYFYNLINNFSQNSEHQVKVFSALYLNDKLNQLPKDIISGSRLNFKIPFTGKILEFFNKFVSNRKMIEFNPNIIHKTYYSNIFKKKKNARVILTVFDLFHENFSSKRNFKPKKKSIDLADHILCPSNNTKDDLIKIYNVDKMKISVTYFGAENLQKYISKENQSQKNQKPYILYVGARSRYKNFINLIKAYSRSEALKKDFNLLCFGGGQFNHTEKRLFIDLNIFDKVKFSISSTDPDLANLYYNAKCLVYPSKHEGLGLPPLEAMSIGCPVICSNHKAILEGVGSAAAIFDPYEINEITDTLEKTIYSENILNDLVKKGREQSKKFTWKKCAEETLKQYENLT